MVKWRDDVNIANEPGWRASCGRCEMSVYQKMYWREDTPNTPWYAMTFIRYSGDRATVTRHRTPQLAKKAASGRCGCKR